MTPPSNSKRIICMRFKVLSLLLFITLLMILIAGPWIMRTLVGFTKDVLTSIPGLMP